ncbi:hypothetical protein BPOR_1012g00010 [Botrytis porri]|uniref:Uncharacterized protein n=1 Tax=Botrytis porri TaxID=87229 RepID=A0A4Z1K8L9_9HELO|nr:hypothetical protein BPOR_1012g00010 [Botrytis porri]
MTTRTTAPACPDNLLVVIPFTSIFALGEELFSPTIRLKSQSFKSIEDESFNLCLSPSNASIQLSILATNGIRKGSGGDASLENFNPKKLRAAWSTTGQF